MIKFRELRHMINERAETEKKKMIIKDEPTLNSDDLPRYLQSGVSVLHLMNHPVAKEHQFKGFMKESVDTETAEGDEVQEYIKKELKSMGKTMKELSPEEKKKLFNRVDAKFKSDDEEAGLDEAKGSYEIYHKDFSTAMKEAYRQAEKMGVKISPEEIDQKVATGPRKPSTGKTNSYRLEGDKGAVQVQVYNTGKSYELNMYKEDVDFDDLVESNDSSIVDTVNKLKKGDTVEIEYNSSIKKGSVGKYKVTAKNTVNKGNVVKTTLQNLANPNGVKSYIYQRKERPGASFAIGDMGASMTSLKLMNEAVDLDEGAFTYKAATFNGNVVKGTGSTREAALKDAEDKAKALGSTIRKRIPEEVDLDEGAFTYKAATFNGNVVKGTGSTREAALKDAEDKAKALGSTIRKRIPEEVDLDEAPDYGLRYKRNEKLNYHIDNDLMLAKLYGTKEEVKKVESIKQNREDRGYLLATENNWLRVNIRKYYAQFKKEHLNESASVLNEAQYSYKIDRMGGVELTNKKTKESAYLQPGDDAEYFIDQLENTRGPRDVDKLISDYDSLMSRDG
jgi:hypothetical protein